MKLLRSRRVAVWLLVLTLGLLILTTLIPNPKFLTEAESSYYARIPIVGWLSRYFTTETVTSSWVFIALLAFQSASAIYCSALRLSHAFKASKRNAAAIKYPTGAGNPTPDFGHARVFEINAPVEDAADRIEAELVSKGWKTGRDASRNAIAIRGSKGLLGTVGSFIFHLSLSAVFILGAITALTKFSGELLITETQTLTMAKENLVSYNKPAVDRNLPAFDITLEKFEPIFAGNEVVDFAAMVRVDSAGGPERKTVRVNEPLTYGDYRLLIYRYGYAPRFVLRESNNHAKDYPVFDSFVNLSVLAPGSTDTFSMRGANVDVKAQFFPDAKVEKGGITNNSARPLNPVFLVEVIKDGKTVRRGPLKPGGSIDFGDSKLELPELKYWVDFAVIGTPTYWPILLTFLLMAVGLVVRFIFPDKRLVVSLSGGDSGSIISLAGHCRHYPALFKEELAGLEREVIDDRDDMLAGQRR